MKRKLKCVLLVDDDKDCNFFHKRLFDKAQCAERVEVVLDGQKALDFLLTAVDGDHPCPDLILLDVNMPGMNGWEFLEEYEKLDEAIKAKVVLVMLTSSINPDDALKATHYPSLEGFRNKFLSEESLKEIIATYFPQYV